MRLDPARLFAPLLATLVLLVVLQQTGSALRSGGVWSLRLAGRPGPRGGAEARTALPVLPRTDEVPARDPFAYGREPAAAPARRPVTVVPRATETAPAANGPLLTSIVWVEGNPSATIRVNGRDYSVRSGTLFDEYRVRSIARDQVTIERGDQVLVLTLPRKGDSV